MMRFNKRVVKFADYCFQRFSLGWRTRVQENIQLSIKKTISDKVVMGGMAKVKADKVVLAAEVFEDGGSCNILRVDIAVASDVDRTGVFFLNHGKTNFKG